MAAGRDLAAVPALVRRCALCELRFGAFSIEREKGWGVGGEQGADDTALWRAEGYVVGQAAVLADQRGAIGIEPRVFLGRGGWIEFWFVVRWRIRLGLR